MQKLGVFEAKTRFSALIDSAVAGKKTIVTRNGKPVAEIGPVTEHRVSRARAALARLRDTRERLAAGGNLRGLNVRELIDEERA